MWDELTFAVKRLIKSLASPLIHTRQGAFVALCEVQREFPFVQSHVILKHLSEELILAASASPTELQNNNLGKIFAAISVIRSGSVDLISDPSKKGAALAALLSTLISTEIEPAADAQSPCDALAEIRLSAIASVLDRIPKKAFESAVLPLYKAKIAALPESLTSDLLTILLKFDSLFQYDVPKALKLAKKGRLMQSDNIESLKTTFLSAISSPPNRHPLWSLAINALPISSTSQEDINAIARFWSIIVEDFLDEKATSKKKTTAYSVLADLLPRLAPHHIPHIFTAEFNFRFAQFIVNSRDLKPIAIKIIDVVVASAKANTNVALEILRQAIQSVNLRSATTSKPKDTARFKARNVFHEVVAVLDDKSILQYVDMLLKTLASPVITKSVAQGEDEKENIEEVEFKKKRADKNSRLWALAELYHIAIHNTSLTKETFEEIVNVFHYLSYFEHNGDVEEIPAEILAAKKAKSGNSLLRFFRALDDEAITEEIRKQAELWLNGLINSLNSRTAEAPKEIVDRKRSAIETERMQAEMVKSLLAILKFEKEIISAKASPKAKEELFQPLVPPSDAHIHSQHVALTRLSLSSDFLATY
eukprot:TRINITY_DN5142_c0_g1_i1.p1 TRINITY_DN5142_c0_g1~~TRINITY_DN5142_c0_g1_i1.p1  ORF type:complete len:651 (+),score=306.24 TRINITY_DN5142_c0_g1_i1:176-1954(+)